MGYVEERRSKPAFRMLKAGLLVKDKRHHEGVEDGHSNTVSHQVLKHAAMSPKTLLKMILLFDRQVSFSCYSGTVS